MENLNSVGQGSFVQQYDKFCGSAENSTDCRKVLSLVMTARHCVYQDLHYCVFELDIQNIFLHHHTQIQLFLAHHVLSLQLTTQHTC